MGYDYLVKVGGFKYPEPSKYNANTATMVDSARNLQGKMVGAVVRHDVAKIDISWRFLTAEQWSSILTPFSTNFENNVTFFNQVTAAWETRRMYVSDRSAGMWRRHPTQRHVMGWTECRLALIEV